MARWLSDPVLKVEHLSMRFGGLTAISNLSFQVGRQEITALIGPNGAGKTTVFNCITGFYKPSEGFLRLQHPDGNEFLLERLDDYIITRKAKVARTFQNIRLFAGMTVLENLMVAQHTRLMQASCFTFAGLLGFPSYRRAEKSAVEKATYWLEQVQLLDRADDPAGDLSYGAQRRLEIARAMCTDPYLLCLDEPAAGLNPRESDELNKILLNIKTKHDVAIILIEHDMSVVMRISDHVVVLDYGQKIADGTPDDVRQDPAVIRAYLGAEDHDDMQVSVPQPVLITQDLPPVVVNEKAAGVSHDTDHKNDHNTDHKNDHTHDYGADEVPLEKVYLADQNNAQPLKLAPGAKKLGANTQAPQKATKAKAAEKTAQAKAPVKAAKAKLPLKTAQARLPVKTAQARLPVKTAQAKAPVKTAQAKAPVKTAQGKVPLKTVKSKTPLKKTTKNKGGRNK